MDPLVAKLNCFAPLSAEERTLLASAYERTIAGAAGSDIVTEGERPQHIHVLLEGWAYRYKMLPDGGRQIMAYLMPGDLCDVHIFILKAMDHSIGLLCDARIGLLTEQAMLDLLDNPRIGRALYLSTLVDDATSREWLANSLRRDPFERVAHLFCELWVRMNAIGLVEADSFDLPLTQAELGDTIGLNPVSVNRVLQRLRAEQMITLGRKRLTLLDPKRLIAISGFDPNYLHLDKSISTHR